MPQRETKKSAGIRGKEGVQERNWKKDHLRFLKKAAKGSAGKKTAESRKKGRR